MPLNLYDRLIRADVFSSDRFVHLPSDTHRVVYWALLHTADDFGNLEGAVGPLWRWLQAFSQVKTEEHLTEVLSVLCDRDLVRAYQVEERGYLHLPRTRPDRRYICRRVPPSPWDDQDTEARAKTIRTYRAARSARVTVAATLPQPSSNVAATLPLGVSGQWKELHPLHTLDQVDATLPQLVPDSQDQVPPDRATRLPKAWTLPEDWQAWALAFAAEQGWQLTPRQVQLRADTFRDYWHGKGGREGVKLDWLATWRNWIRNTDLAKLSTQAQPDADRFKGAT